MNERIKLLESQCWESRQYGPAWFNSTKFAELIVRECCLVIRNDGSAFNNMRYTRVEIANMIEEHFRS